MEEEDSDANPPAHVLIQDEEDDNKLIGLMGEINEEITKEVIGCLLNLNGNQILPTSEEELKETSDIEMVISSGGGDVHNMFAIYDVMKIVEKNTNIVTIGLGHVSSAAVLLLAAGTKGSRYITKNTRVMLHNCSHHYGGTTPAIISSSKELEKIQNMMIQRLAENSKLSVGEIYNIFSRNIDEYFSAEEALEMGLVDKII